MQKDQIQQTLPLKKTMLSANAALLLILVLLNFVLKLWFADRRDIALDEPFTIWWAQQDISSIFGILKGGNDSPLYYLFLHFWIQLFDIGAFSVRLPSVLFSSLAAGLIFLTGVRFFNRNAGIFAALLFTFSTLQVYFAHEARVYALFTLLTVWSLYLSLALYYAPHRKRLFVALFFCNLLLVYSHYLGWIAAGMQFLILMALPVRKFIWKPLLLATLTLLVCYIPYFHIFFERMGSFSQGTWVQKPVITELYGNINRFLNSRYVTAAFIVLIIAWMLIMRYAPKLRLPADRCGNRTGMMIAAAWFFVPYISMFAVSFVFPVFIDRYILFIMPGLYLLIALAFACAPLHRALRYVCFALFLGVMLVFFDPNPDNNRRVQELTQVVKVLKQPGSVVIISPEYAHLEFVYHYDVHAFRDYKNTKRILQGANIFPARSVAQLPAGVLDSARHIIYVDCGSAFAFGEDAVGDALSLRFTEGGVYNVPEIYQIRVFYR